MATLQKLIESEIADFFAGFGSPGEPESPAEMQSQLLARVAPLLASKEREPDFYVVVTSVGVRQSFLKNRAEAEHIIKQPFHKGYSLEAAYFEPLEVK